MSDADRADFEAMLTELDAVRFWAEAAGGKVCIEGWPVAVRKSPVHGHGAFAREPLAQGRLIFPAILGGRFTSPGWHMNHGAHPNVTAAGPAAPTMELTFFARRDIAAGEELLADYRQVVRICLASSLGCAPAALTRKQIRSALAGAASLPNLRPLMLSPVSATPPRTGRR